MVYGVQQITSAFLSTYNSTPTPVLLNNDYVKPFIKRVVLIVYTRIYKKSGYLD